MFGKASGFAANIDLSSLDGTTGFKLSGAAAGDISGCSVASAGDVNGDGFADLIVGAFTADPHGTSSGASYVVFGALPDTAVNRTGTGASQTLAGGNFNDTLSGLGGDDRLYGHGGSDTAVFSGARANYSIVSNSGPAGTTFTVTDLRAGSPDGTDTLTGIETLQFSDATVAATQFPANIDLSTLDGTTGFKLSGEAAADYSGRTVASAGDVNGDGFADVIVGAWKADAPGVNSGASYVVFGKASGFAANIDLSSLDGSIGFKLSGAAAGDQSGISVASAGDVNGDGFADLIVGAHAADSHGTNSGAELCGVRQGVGLCRQYRSLGARRRHRLQAQRGGGLRLQRRLGGLGRRRQRRRLRRPDRRRLVGRPARQRIRRQLRGIRQGIGLCRQRRPLLARRQQPASGSAARRRTILAASRWPRPATSTATASPT